MAKVLVEKLFCNPPDCRFLSCLDSDGLTNDAVADGPGLSFGTIMVFRLPKITFIPAIALDVLPNDVPVVPAVPP